ncbi:MAG TPA: hypothetical protein PJ982_16905 [Lacipirellulaceae bacterium]|nr:hypothetical protein [Lacipirellulaceae bacterium]
MPAAAAGRMMATMQTIPRKLVVDERGAPLEVILPWPAFCELAETLGWDLDDAAQAELREARQDLAAGRSEAFVPLGSP